MDSNQVFGAVRKAALASLVVGGLVVTAGCKSGGDASCGSKSCSGTKTEEKTCGADGKSCGGAGGEHKCGADGKSCGAK